MLFRSDSHNAPKTIQFMSIDTEGSELDILRSYSFGARQIMSICVEHNYQPRARAGIYDLLTSKGYKRVFEKISKCDDWYVLDTF